VSPLSCVDVSPPTCVPDNSLTCVAVRLFKDVGGTELTHRCRRKCANLLGRQQRNNRRHKDNSTSCEVLREWG
jgi:hypothetical protein